MLFQTLHKGPTHRVRSEQGESDDGANIHAIVLPQNTFTLQLVALLNEGLEVRGEFGLVTKPQANQHGVSPPLLKGHFIDANKQRPQLFDARFKKGNAIRVDLTRDIHTAQT